MKTQKRPILFVGAALVSLLAVAWWSGWLDDGKPEVEADGVAPLPVVAREEPAPPTRPVVSDPSGDLPRPPRAEEEALVPASGRRQLLLVEVRTASSTPLAAAALSIRHSSDSFQFQQQGLTSADGQFFLDRERMSWDSSGRAELLVQKHGYRPVLRTIDSSRDRLVVDMEVARALAVHVVDALGGHPLPSARVGVYVEAGEAADYVGLFRGTTDRNGHVTVGSVPDGVQTWVVAEADGYVQGMLPARAPETTDTATLVVELRRGRTLRLQAHAPDDTSIPGCDFEIRDFSTGFTSTVTASEDGWAKFDGVPAGDRDYDVRVMHSDFGVRDTRVRILADEDEHAERIELSPGASLQLVLRGSKGDPREGHVRITGDTGRVGHRLVGDAPVLSRGRPVLFSSLPSETPLSLVVIQHQAIVHQEDGVRLSSGEVRSMDITIAETVKLTLRAHHADGTPARGSAAVTSLGEHVQSVAGPFGASKTVPLGYHVEVDGQATLDVFPGEYRVSLALEGGGRATARELIVTDSMIELGVSSERDVAGVVRGVNGMPLPGLDLELRGWAGKRYATTDGDGGFRFQFLAEGEHDGRIVLPAQLTGDVVLADGIRTPVDGLELTHGVADVSGRVVAMDDLRGLPAIVEIRRREPGLDASQTVTVPCDDLGEFSVQLPPGDWTAVPAMATLMGEPSPFSVLLGQEVRVECFVYEGVDLRVERKGVAYTGLVLEARRTWGLGEWFRSFDISDGDSESVFEAAVPRGKVELSLYSGEQFLASERIEVPTGRQLVVPLSLFFSR